MFLISVCLLFLYSRCTADQDTINYLGTNIHLQYNVLDNLGSASNFEGQMLLTNTGPDDVTDLNWSLYFCSMPLFEPRFIEPDGADLGNSSLRVYRLNGCMHRIDPTPSFPGFLSGETTEVLFEASGSQIMATGIMPNWYFAAVDAEPRVCANTAQEDDLSWIGEFNTPNQWKRSNLDTYDPYTGPDRFTMYNYSDLGEAPAASVIPTPLENNLDPQTFVNIGTGEWVVVIGDPAIEGDAQYLADALGTVAVDPQFTPSSHYILVSLDGVIDTSGKVVNESEAYRMDVAVSSHMITISGNDPDGVFHCIQSLLSLYDVSPEIPGGFLVDYPRFHYRGMHLDVSRHFYEKQDVLRLLNVMATYKMNKFHFHLSDDEGWRLEIPGIPELTEFGSHRCHDLSEQRCLLPQFGSAPGLTNSGSGHYTVSDYKQILAYANTRHIQVIPEIDTPGHSDAAIKSMLVRYNKYADTNMTAATEFLLSDLNDHSDYRSVQGYANNSMNPCLSSSYAFVEHVVKEVKEMHSGIQPLTTYHFGGDEVPGGAWEDSPACYALSNDTGVLEEYFMENVAHIVNDKGLDLSGWEDGFLAGIPQAPVNRTYFPNPNVFTYVWNNMYESGNGKNAYLLANGGYKTVLAVGTHFYFDHPHEPDPYDRGHYWATRLSGNYKVFGFMPDDMYENMGDNSNGNPNNKENICALFGCPPLDPGMEDNIIGVQGQLWSEHIHNPGHLDQNIFPRLVVLAERAWHKASWENTQDTTLREEERIADFERFANTMGYKELARLEVRGVLFNINPPGAQIAEFNRLEAMAEFPGSPMVYSTDGGQTWTDYTDGQTMQPGTVLVVTRSPDGSRSSRQVELTVI